MKKIILASTSPRRKDLLKQLIGDNFEIIACDYEENNNLNLTPQELVKLHALEKAKDVAKKINSGIIIGCDTICFFEGKILGKPKTKEKAEEMLTTMSGKYIEALSGIALIDVDNKIELISCEISKLKLKKLTKKEINNYILNDNPLDKAGAFGIQDRGAIFIERIEGDYNNIVGLPLFRLNEMFNKIGINIFDYKR